MEYGLVITIALTLLAALAALLMARGAWAFAMDGRRWAGRRSQREYRRRTDSRIRLLAKDQASEPLSRAYAATVEAKASSSGATLSPRTTTGPSSGRSA